MVGIKAAVRAGATSLAASGKPRKPRTAPMMMNAVMVARNDHSATAVAIRSRRGYAAAFMPVVSVTTPQPHCRAVGSYPPHWMVLAQQLVRPQQAQQ